MKNRLLPLLAIFLLLCPPLFAFDPQTNTIDDGNLTFFILNTGTFGFDPYLTRDNYTGLYYPGNTYKGIMAGGGIWIAGKRDTTWYLTVSGDDSEFLPGPIGADGKPADTLLPIYKITRGEDYLQNDDYRNWPGSLGAPEDLFGNPLITGSQSLFTIFNDADTAAHVFEGFSSGIPLRVEVKLYAHTWDNDYQFVDTMYTQIIELDYTITNRSGTEIESCIVSIFADPDIGFGRTDRIGTNAATSSAYVYDEANFDSDFGQLPPVVGIALLGTEAASANYYYPCASVFPECYNVNEFWEALSLVKGNRPNGEPYIDASTRRPTKFPYDGNPLDSSGWVSTLSRDYRFLLNTAPVDLAAGDSIKLRAALIVAKGSSSREGTQRFLQTAAMLRQLHQSDTTAPVITVDGPTTPLPEMLDFDEAAGDIPSERVLNFTNTTGFTQTINIASSHPLYVRATPASFELGPRQQKSVSVLSSTPYDHETNPQLMILSNGFERNLQTIALRITPATLTAIGDANSDAKFDFADLLAMIGFLYRGQAIQVPIRQIDADCDWRFSLADLVAFINYIYESSALPCRRLPE